ncbi:DUF6326 family protein [Microbacterium sp. SA39]|uniref:DUF6326 family protein n=1 Tax=Microbacterium sp. SA39 TaxID=1263625 RepID=UPI0005FA3955|nr:DUF6326 family protein [Microbacterium sp. SA39]KJQ53859.1 hypothetical protein RS85_02411 [Microbacterium sp. SA39]
MSTRESTPPTLQEQRMPVRAKLATAWASFMFLYIYVDILAFYKPGVVDDILVGVVWQFDITQTWAVTALALLAIPILMVMLSTALPARASRIANLVVGSMQVPFAAFNAVGEWGGSWILFYVLGVALELAVLACILRWAWTWPRAGSATGTAADAVLTAPQA